MRKERPAALRPHGAARRGPRDEEERRRQRVAAQRGSQRQGDGGVDVVRRAEAYEDAEEGGMVTHKQRRGRGAEVVEEFDAHGGRGGGGIGSGRVGAGAGGGVSVAVTMSGRQKVRLRAIEVLETLKWTSLPCLAKKADRSQRANASPPNLQ